MAPACVQVVQLGRNCSPREHRSQLRPFGFRLPLWWDRRRQHKRRVIPLICLAVVRLEVSDMVQFWECSPNARFRGMIVPGLTSSTSPPLDRRHGAAHRHPRLTGARAWNRFGAELCRVEGAGERSRLVWGYCVPEGVHGGGGIRTNCGAVLARCAHRGPTVHLTPVAFWGLPDPDQLRLAGRVCPGMKGLNVRETDARPPAMNSCFFI
jgi:hypothetical protein